MKIPLNFDVVDKEPPSADKGTDPFNNPQIMPSKGKIADTPGENAVNSTEPDMINKAQPFKTKGAGYC